MSLSHLPHRYTVLRYTVLQYMTSCSSSVGMLNIDCSAVGTTQQLWWWRKWHTIHASPRSLGRSSRQLSGMPLPACDKVLLLLLLKLLSKTHQVRSWLQVDSFNRHASGKSGNKLIARLPNKLFGSKKSPRTPSPSSGGLVPSPSGNSITLDDMLVYQNVSCQAMPSPNSLLPTR